MARRHRLRGAQHRLLRGYAPLAVMVAALVAMVVVVPSQLPDGGTASAGGGAAEAGTVGQPASGWGKTVTACTNRKEQAPGADYSPPCVQFSGDNGGATSRGVTADTIKISYRVTADPDLLALLAQFSGIPWGETEDDLVRTADGLVDYFNKNFQFYGRKLQLVRYGGRGSTIAEFQGAGQDNANNDAIKVANEIGAFADVTAITQPYAEALARNKVVSVGAPCLSRQWFEAHRPYAWSIFPDCTIAGEAATSSPAASPSTCCPTTV